MNVLCTICSDLVNQAENIYVTKCGHIFHHQCLAQWIERSKTCPQCRNKVTDKCMFRLYPTVSNENSGEDAATLQSRLDDAQLQLRQQRVKAKEKEDKLTVATADLKRQDDLLKSYEKRLVSFDSKVLALREQLELVNVQNKEMQKIKEENEALKKKMQTLNGLQTVLNATCPDVELMLDSYSDVRTIATFAAALKRALCDSESKNIESRNRLHVAKQQLALERKNVADMQNKMDKLEGDLRAAQEKYDDLKNKNAQYAEPKRVVATKHHEPPQYTTDEEDNSSFTDNARGGTDDSRVDNSKDLERKKKAAWLNVLSPRAAKINQTRAEEAALAKFNKIKKKIKAVIIMERRKQIPWNNSYEAYEKDSNPEFEQFLKETDNARGTDDSCVDNSKDLERKKKAAWLNVLSPRAAKINQTRAEEAALAKFNKIKKKIKAVIIMERRKQIPWNNSYEAYEKDSNPEFEQFLKETDNARGTDDSRVDNSKDLERKKIAAWLNVLSPRAAKSNQTRTEEAALAKFNKIKKKIKAVIIMQQRKQIPWNNSYEAYEKDSNPEFEQFLKENGLVHKIENSDSPYLTLKQGGGLCLAALQRAPMKLSEAAPYTEKLYQNAVRIAHQKRVGEKSNAISTKHSIFNKKEPLNIETLDTTIPKIMDTSYDGLGGHSKPDVFPVPNNNAQSRIPKISAKHKLKRPNPQGSQDIEKLLKKVKNK